MEAKAKAGEEDLSMEEILQSIRKIIADDGDEAPPNGASPPASDVLELSDMVEAPKAAEPAAPPPPPAAQVNDILHTIDRVVVSEPVVAAPAPPPVAVHPAPSMVAGGQASIDSLLSSEAAHATAAAFKKAQPMDMPLHTTPSPQFRGGNSVEDLVMEALKPMLKEWLDANLPDIVERLVDREVRKLAH